MNYVRSSFQVWPSATEEYRDNWDRIFAKKSTPQGDAQGATASDESSHEGDAASNQRQSVGPQGASTT